MTVAILTSVNETSNQNIKENVFNPEKVSYIMRTQRTPITIFFYIYVSKHQFSSQLSPKLLVLLVCIQAWKRYI